MTEQDLKEFMESGMEVGPPTDHRLSVTGEPYVVLASGGIKPEGMPYPQRCASRGEAIRSFLSEFRKYKASVGRGGRLYWRWPPETIRHREGEVSVSARLLISKNTDA